MASVNIGSGFLRPNEEKTSDKQPILKGGVKIEQALPAGTMIWIAAWKNEPNEQYPKPSLGLRISVKEEVLVAKAPSPPKKQSDPFDDIFGGNGDEIPF